MDEQLSDLEAVRKRPGMFVGDLGSGGVQHLIWELVANALDEHLAGHGSSISITLTDEGITVEDDGRGIPLDDCDGLPRPERAVTSLHRTPSFDGHAPHEHVVTHGVGMFVVGALSKSLELDIFREGRHHRLEMERGHLVRRLHEVGPSGRRGTRVTFAPDPTVFTSVWLNPGPLLERLRELSFLLPGLKLALQDLRRHCFLEQRGLVDWVEGRLQEARAPGEPVFSARGTHGSILVEVGAAWGAPHWCSTVESYANIARTTEGGTHVEGLLSGLGSGLRRALPAGKVGSGAALRRRVQDGLNGIVCVRLNDPHYGAPTKSRLVTPEAKRAVQRVVGDAFAEFLKEQPALLKRFASLLLTE